MLEQHLDEAYAEKIKASSEDIETIVDFIKNDGNVTPTKNLDNVRRLCKAPLGRYEAKRLSTYIDDLEKGIKIHNNLMKLRAELPVLERGIKSLQYKEINEQSGKIKTQADELHKQLEPISDNEIKESLDGKLTDVREALRTAENIIKTGQDLETLQKEIDELKTHPTTEKTVFDDIANRLSGIENKINNANANENEILQDRLQDIKKAFSTQYDRLRKPINNLTKELTTIQSDFVDFIHNLPENETPSGKKQRLTQYYDNTVLQKIQQAFEEATNTVNNITSVKEVCQRARDTMITMINLTKELGTIRLDFVEFIHKLPKSKPPPDKKQLLKKHYVNTVLPKIQRAFEEATNTVNNLTSVKEMLQRICDAGTKETRSMYDNFYEKIE